MGRLTFEEQYTEAQEMAGDKSATTLILLKRWINKAKDLFNSAMGRYYTQQVRKADLKKDQSSYQMPEDCIKIKGIRLAVGGQTTPLIEVKTDYEWDLLNISAQSGTPTHFFVKGPDEYELWPTPSADSTAGIILKFEASEKDMTQADYKTGTVNVTNGSVDVTGSGTTFTPAMVGRYLKINDDEESYKISAYVSATAIKLENYYDGLTQEGAGFRIGQCSQVPGEFHESFVDYAMFRYEKFRKDRASASDYKVLFDDAIAQAKQKYGSRTTSRVIHKSGINRQVIARSVFQQNNEIE